MHHPSQNSTKYAHNMNMHYLYKYLPGPNSASTDISMSGRGTVRDQDIRVLRDLPPFSRTLATPFQVVAPPTELWLPAKVVV